MNPRDALVRLLEREKSLGHKEIFLPDSARGDMWIQSEREINRRLQRDRDRASQCVACALHRERTQVVYGEGNPRARLFLLGEGPGAEEDRKGRPFVGACGELLNKMLGAIHIERSEVYICNAVKCRPPNNRTPCGEEIDACQGFMQRQIEWIHPSVILVLGRVALRALKGEDVALTKMRGVVHYYKDIPMVATFHPGYLLRNPADKRLAWEDLKRVAGLLGQTVPSEGG